MVPFYAVNCAILLYVCVCVPGEKLSLADVALFPFLNGLELVMRRMQEIEHKSPSPAGDAEITWDWPKLMAFRRLISEQQFVKATGYTDAAYENFVLAHVTKDPNRNY